MRNKPDLDEMFLHETIHGYEEEFKSFTNRDEFPNYDIDFFDIDMEELDRNGFCAAAQAEYNPKTDKHTLFVCRELVPMKYLIFHELTHIIDSEDYAKSNSENYMYVSGYTEYHAAQVELMVLLGANNINEKMHFSMDKNVDTIAGSMSVNMYLRSKIDVVTNTIGKEDFPSSIEIAKGVLGVLYNYWGLRSVCKLYATDYNECIDFSIVKKQLNPYWFAVTNLFMDGWFDNEKVKMSFAPYSNAIMPLLVNNKLV